MKKTLCLIFALILLTATVLPISTSAATPKSISIIPSLGFDGTTAELGLEVNCGYLTDSISAVVILWEGNFALDQWHPSGSGFLDFIETYSVSRGHTYTLTADVTINGVTRPRVSITRTCN